MKTEKRPSTVVGLGVAAGAVAANELTSEDSKANEEEMLRLEAEKDKEIKDLENQINQEMQKI